MTVAEVQSNEELRQFEFPVTRERIFLAHAGVCPLPRRVHEAVRTYTEGCMKNDQESLVSPGWFRETRELAARFMGVTAAEIAFVAPTSLGLSMVAEGLKVRRNQNVLVYQDDFPSNVFPWMAMANRGIEVRFLNIREFGCIRPRDVVGQLDENTRMVALGSCHYLAGYRIDLEAIGRELHERGILFCVDGIQTLGAFPMNLAHVDVVAADAHKWLLGPCGTGVLFVRKQAQEEIRPITHGWHNLRCPDYVAIDDLEYKADARRYEAGSHNLIGLAALRACFELLAEAGLDQISRDLIQKRTWLRGELQRRGYTVLAAEASAENSGSIISFFKAGSDMAQLHQKLEAAGIVTSLRGDRRKQKYIRISPHFYNTMSELEKTVSLL